MLTFKDVVSADLKPPHEAMLKWEKLPGKMRKVKGDFDSRVKKPFGDSDWRGETAEAVKAQFKRAARELEFAAATAEYVHKSLSDAYRDLDDAKGRLEKCRGEIEEDKYLKLDERKGEVSFTLEKAHGLDDGEKQSLSKGYSETVRSYNGRIGRAMDDAIRADRTLKWALEWDPNGVYPGFSEHGNPPLLPSDRRPFNVEDPNSTDQNTWWKVNTLILSGLAYQGYGNAYNLLTHYMERTGKGYKVDPAVMLQSLPRFRKTLGEDLAKYKGKSSFDTGWQSTRANEKDSLDWYYALNGFQYRVQGRQVYDGSGKPRMVAELSVYKRYNWGNGSESVPRKDLHKGPIELKQKDMAHLHTSGMAREYNVVGKTRFVVGKW